MHAIWLAILRVIHIEAAISSGGVGLHIQATHAVCFISCFITMNMIREAMKPLSISMTSAQNFINLAKGFWLCKFDSHQSCVWYNLLVLYNHNRFTSEELCWFNGSKIFTRHWENVHKSSITLHKRMAIAFNRTWGIIIISMRFWLF